MNYYWFLKFNKAGLEKLRQIVDESDYSKRNLSKKIGYKGSNYINEILKGESKLNYAAFVTLFNIVGEDPNKFLGSGYATIVGRREAIDDNKS